MCDSTDKIYSAVQDIKQDAVESILSTSLDKILPDNFEKKIDKMSDYMLSTDQYAEKLRGESLWKQKYYHETRLNTDIKEGLENMNNQDNMELINSLHEAINSRHQAFYGISTFEKDCTENADNTISNNIKKEKNDMEKLKNYFLSYISSYESLYNYKISLGAIVNEKISELEKIQKKVDTYKQNLYIDNRKDSYQRKNYEFYNNIHFYIKLLYYSLLVLYLIFSNFFSEKKYLNKYYIILLVIYIILPFILKYILNYIYMAYIYVLEYFNLRDKIISYPYIITDEEKKHQYS